MLIFEFFILAKKRQVSNLRWLVHRGGSWRRLAGLASLASLALLRLPARVVHVVGAGVRSGSKDGSRRFEKSHKGYSDNMSNK